MEKGGVFLKLVALIAISFIAMLQAFEAAASSLPTAHMPATVFKAPDIVAGDDIVHDFIIQNNGTGVLKVAKGKSACGYTVDSVPAPIPPGMEGVITVRLSTCSSGGKTLKKTLTVRTNDVKNKRIALTVQAKVIKPYTLSKNNIKLQGRLKKTIKKTLSLSPTKENPFTVLEVTAKRGGNIRYDLEEVVKKNQVRYKLTVENIATAPGNYYDTLYLKTDSSLQPVISVVVVGKIAE